MATKSITLRSETDQKVVAMLRRMVLTSGYDPGGSSGFRDSYLLSQLLSKYTDMREAKDTRARFERALDTFHSCEEENKCTNNYLYGLYDTLNGDFTNIPANQEAFPQQWKLDLARLRRVLPVARRVVNHIIPRDRKSVV